MRYDLYQQADIFEWVHKYTAPWTSYGMTLAGTHVHITSVRVPTKGCTNVPLSRNMDILRKAVNC